MLYLTKRFEAAVRALVGDGPIKQRLATTYARYLEDVFLPDLPDPVRARFERLHDAMHSAAPIGKETSLNVSVRKMSAAEATAHAETIIELYAELVRTVDRVEPLKVVHNEEKAQRLASG